MRGLFLRCLVPLLMTKVSIQSHDFFAVHMDVCRVILDYMKFIEYYPAGYKSAEQYIQAIRMELEAQIQKW